jgi:hypothetical protein
VADSDTPEGGYPSVDEGGTESYHTTPDKTPR